MGYFKLITDVLKYPYLFLILSYSPKKKCLGLIYMILEFLINLGGKVIYLSLNHLSRRYFKEQIFLVVKF